jgi:hypothetical protein
VLCAVAAKRSDIHGLFAGPGPAEAPTQPPLHWERIATLPGHPAQSLTRVTAVCCYDGRAVLAAAHTAHQTPTGQRTVVDLFRIDVAGGQVSPMPLDPSLDAPTTIELIATAPEAAFAATDDGRVLVWTGARWTAMTTQPPANGRLIALAVDRSSQPLVLFAATDQRVYLNPDPDAGGAWREASDGLPKRVNCADLRLVEDGEGVHLYLWSHGRSLWIASRPGDGW